MQEYPKALFKMGEVRVVFDAAGEALALHDGYDHWHADQARINGAPVEPPEPEQESPRAKRAYTKRAAQ